MNEAVWFPTQYLLLQLKFLYFDVIATIWQDTDRLKGNGEMERNMNRQTDD